MILIPLVSIIMPVYNTGIIIHNSIKSILSQTFVDFELIIVDDGSTDISTQICDEYVKSDSRIRLIRKPNGGICDARNVGLREAKGKYIAFCDHDDEYDEYLLEKSVNALRLHDADLVKYGVIYEIESGKSTKKEVRNKHSAVLSKNDIKDNFTAIWDGVYKRSMLVNNNITFDTSFKKGFEDIWFNNDIIPNIEKMVLIDDILYTHYIRESLSTSAKFYDEIIDKFVEYPSEIRSLLIAIGGNVNDQAVAYYYFFTQRTLVSILSYMTKMRKDKHTFRTVLQKLYLMNPDIVQMKVPVFDYYKYIPHKKYLLGYFIIILFKLKRFDLVYLIAKLIM